MLNASYHTEAIRKVCESKADARFEGSKELKGKVIVNGVNLANITVSKGKKFAPPKTYKSMASQLHLSVDEFDSFLKCTMKKNEFLELLTKRTNE